MAYEIERLSKDPALQEKVKNKINSGKKVVFKFQTAEEKIKFIDRTNELFARRGFATGTLVGGVLGSFLGLPTLVLGAAIGGAIGTVIGYSLGVWLANFLWDNVINKTNMKIKEAFAWFGLTPNRMAVCS